MFEIQSGAHRNILSEAKWFTNKPNLKIRFVDKHANYIELTTSTKHVKLTHKNPSSIIEELPINYKTYTVVYNKERASPTAADAVIMATWQSAKHVDIDCFVGYPIDKPKTDFANKLFEFPKLGAIIRYHTIGYVFKG